jgi:hypothetical protein
MSRALAAVALLSLSTFALVRAAPPLSGSLPVAAPLALAAGDAVRVAPAATTCIWLVEPAHYEAHWSSCTMFLESRALIGE